MDMTADMEEWYKQLTRRFEYHGMTVTPMVAWKEEFEQGLSASEAFYLVFFWHKPPTYKE